LQLVIQRIVAVLGTSYTKAMSPKDMLSLIVLTSEEIVFVIVVITGKILLSARNRLLLELDKLGDKFLGHAIVDFLAKGV